jgi:hypothetical protein
MNRRQFLAVRQKYAAIRNAEKLSNPEDIDNEIAIFRLCVEFLRSIEAPQLQRFLVERQDFENLELASSGAGKAREDVLQELQSLCSECFTEFCYAQAVS